MQILMGNRKQQRKIKINVLYPAVCVLLCTIFCNIYNVRAQNKPALEYQVKAAFLFNFTRFVNWPESPFKSGTDPFVIGIIGNDPFGPYIEELVDGESFGDHPIIIERYTDVKEIGNCQILYVNSNDAKMVKEVLAACAHKNILTVSDASRFASLGGVIGFYKEQNKIKVQINVKAAKAAEVEISSKLLKISKIY